MRYVYIARVRPGTLCQLLGQYGLPRKLISVRRTGCFVRGDKKYLVSYETFGKSMDEWINKKA
jgi:hypothetical protein